MRRRVAIALALAGAAIVLPIAVAGAQSETPAGRFTSPTRAVAGQPIFVRSITPCPPTPALYGWVSVFILQQTDLVSDGIEATTADLRPDGSWEVTLSAPIDMPMGVTKSYSIHAQCIAYSNPYFAPGDPSITTTTLPPASSYHRYFLRPLYVTGFGPSDVVEGEGPSGTTSTSTASTTTLAPSSTTAAPGPGGDGVVAQAAKSDPAARVPVETDAEKQARIATIRAELAAQGVDVDAMSDTEVLAIVPAASASPADVVDGGIPWWAFVLATFLAVGAIVAWGQRRAVSPVVDASVPVDEDSGH